MSDPTTQSLIEDHIMLDHITRWVVQRLSLARFKDLTIGSKLLADIQAEVATAEREAAAVLMKAALDLREAGTITVTGILAALAKVGYAVEKPAEELATAVSRAKALIEMQLK